MNNTLRDTDMTQSIFETSPELQEEWETKAGELVASYAKRGAHGWQIECAELNMQDLVCRIMKGEEDDYFGIDTLEGYLDMYAACLEGAIG